MTPDELKDLARRFFQEVWNDGDEAAIDRYIAADARGNDPDFGAGREAFRRQWRQWHAGFPDIHFEVVDVIAERDRVLTRWVLTGTHTGEYMGLAPTGRRVEVHGMSLDIIADGMIVEGFDGWDALGFRQQLGMIEQ
jgi:steroid delta-isomerase-like uncharacterized protein